MRKILAFCGVILLLGVCFLQAEENGSGFNFGATITPTALEGDMVYSFRYREINGAISLKAGNIWTQVTLESQGEYASSKRILTGLADVSGQPAGTGMLWKITTYNLKRLKAHGIGLLWN